MKEEKKTFKEKWQDKKYQAKVKLSGYGVFILIVIIMLAFGQDDTNTNDNNIDTEKVKNDILYEQDEIKFDKPKVNTYTYKIEIIKEFDNVKEIVKYNGQIDNDKEELIKIVDNIEFKYKIKDNKYYVLDGDNYVITSKNKVYDAIDYKYLDIDNINSYLSVSKKVGNEYRVFLDDIILDADSVSDKYITIITITKNNRLEIDYTNLINYLNKTEYDNYVVNINYEV